MESDIGVFLDRDGVISRDTSLVKSKSELGIFENAAEAIKLLNEIGPVIVVTNQPHVARGLITEAELGGIHRHMVKELVKKGARIDAIYYCPHHPEKHHEVPGWAKKYRIDCQCRKPKPGMLQQAARDFSLDLKKCFLVGDRTVDILAGKNAGCKTILVKTGEGGKDGKYDVNPDYVCEDIYDAVMLIRGAVKKEA